MTNPKPKLRSQIANGLEVLKLASCGYNDADIAKMLHLSPDTVRSRIKTFYATIRVKNRHHALAIAVVQGWLTEADLRPALYNLRPLPKKDNNGTDGRAAPTTTPTE